MRWRRAVLAVFTFLFSACSKPAVDASGRTVVRFLAGPDVGGGQKAIIARFEALNPGLKVEMVEGPAASNTREDMYAAAFIGKESTYDVLYMDVVWLPKFAAQGWLRPLDDRFPPQRQAEFLPGDILGSKFAGKTYRLPVQSDGGLLYYRKDLLAAADLAPPRTWAELAAAAKAVQKPPETWGLVFQGKQYEGLVCVYLELLWGNGGELIDEAGTVLVDSPAAVEALTWLVDAVRKDGFAPEGVLTFQEEEARHMFQEGKAVFMRNWPYAWNLLQAEGSPVKGKVGILPMVHGPGKASAATLGGWGWGISAFSEHPEAAWKFIEFAASLEGQKTAYVKGGIIPTRKALFEDPEIAAKSPHYRELLGVLAGARPRPMHPAWARMSDILQVRLSGALSGQASPEDALRAAAEDMRAALAR
ncbi:MAG: ABC transporter substrate-binding protein [Elusimicrobia bacterium]|nr:ABC transporter substrate-binding protein [Elusimicrobiota bacterium]